MDEIFQVLWEYAAEHHLDSCYTTEGWQIKQGSERLVAQGKAALQDALSPELRTHLENLLEELNVIRREDLYAAFVCGLRLGLSLR